MREDSLIKESSRSMNTQKSRRSALKKITLGAGLAAGAVGLPRQWAQPFINAVVVPAHAQTSPPPTTPPCTVYQIGDTGPGGGLVFYTSNGGCSGLEAAPADQSRGQWGCLNTDVSGADGTAIGTGAVNTAAILSASCNVNTDAANQASNYGGGGFSDWFLPSQDELNEMYTQLHQNGLGGFDSFSYWSSSEVDDGSARLQNFNNGSQSTGIKDSSLRVRAVRAF